MAHLGIYRYRLDPVCYWSFGPFPLLHLRQSGVICSNYILVRRVLPRSGSVRRTPCSLPPPALIILHPPSSEVSDSQPFASLSKSISLLLTPSLPPPLQDSTIKHFRWNLQQRATPRAGWAFGPLASGLAQMPSRACRP